jgi:hypothetical protein
MLSRAGSAAAKALTVAGFSAGQGAMKKVAPKAAPWIRVGTAIAGFVGKIVADPARQPILHGTSDALMSSAIAAPAEAFGEDIAAGLRALREEEQVEPYVEDARAHYVAQEMINSPNFTP